MAAIKPKWRSRLKMGRGTVVEHMKKYKLD